MKPASTSSSPSKATAPGAGETEAQWPADPPCVEWKESRAQILSNALLGPLHEAMRSVESFAEGDLPPPQRETLRQLLAHGKMLEERLRALAAILGRHEPLPELLDAIGRPPEKGLPLDSGPASSTAPPGNRTTPRVLVVDDHSANRQIIIRFLNRLGIQAHHAENGFRCLEMHAATSYDLILMDVQMPGLSGIEATRAIRQAETCGRRTRIIAVTAISAPGIREELMGIGMDDYLRKPFQFAELEALLNGAFPQSHNDAV